MSLADEKGNDYWFQSWKTGFTPWVRSEPNQWLWKYIHLLKNPDNPDGDVGGGDVLLVPMCSKVWDLKALYQRGFRVVGVELCEQAVQEFFQEQELQFVTREEPRVEGGCTEYSTPDGGLRILVADFMKVTPEVIGSKVKMVWDRGSMGSIAKNFRTEYMKTMKQLLDPDFRYLLDCFHYNDWYTDEAPRNLPRDLIPLLFDDGVKIQHLDKESGSYPRIHPEVVVRNIYFITPK